MEPTTLTTDRLVLRPHVPADLDETFAALQDPEIQRWISVTVPYERADAEKYVLESAPAGWAEGTGFDFAVRLGAEGPLVATLGIHKSGENSHEIGFWTVAGHRGKGYMTEAVLAAARWAFTELGCVRLVWRAGDGNTGSRAVAEKAGFVVEGLQRSAMEHRGFLRDCWVGALLPADLGLPSRLPHESAAVSTGTVAGTAPVDTAELAEAAVSARV